MAWGQITDEAVAEAATLIDVPLRRDRMQWVTAATKDAVQHFVWGIGDNNPLWRDPDYATSTRWKTPIVPGCFLYAVDYTVVAPKLPGVQWIYAGTHWTWFDAIYVGDEFDVEAKLIDQQEKTGRRFPRWLLQTGSVDYRTKDGRRVAHALGHCARTPRAESGTGEGGESGNGGTAIYRYSPDELAAIEKAVLAEAPRGAETLYWEDVTVGDAVPSVVKGPLSIMDIVAWYSATQGAQPYGGVHADAVRYRQRHADFHINAETGAKDAAGRGHVEAQTGQDVGMGGTYDIGPQRIAWAGHMLTNWIGDDGFLHRLDVDVRSPNLVGSTTWWNGTVVQKWQEDGECFVGVEVVASNQRGERSAWGEAVVVLPSRNEGAVSLPLMRRYTRPTNGNEP